MRCFMSILFFIVAAICVTSCGDDEGDSTPDLTTQIQGTYEGDYTEVAPGSGLTLGEIEATVSKVSGTQVGLTIKEKVFFVGMAFSGDMTDETTFTVPAFTYEGRSLTGTGSLTGTMLKVELEDGADEFFMALYEGEKK